MKVVSKHIIESIKGNDFLKVSLKNSSQVLIRFIVGILNIKILSVWLGTTGIALLGQFGSFIQIAVNVAGGGVNQGVTKLISVYSSSPNRSRLVLGNALLITFLLSVIASMLSYVFADYFSGIILNDVIYAKWFRVGGIIFFSISSSNVLLAYLNGRKKYSLFIRLNVIIILSNFIISIPCIYIWKVEGAIVAQYISACINIFAVFIFCKNEIIEVIRKFQFSGYINKRILGFGFMLLIASCISPLISIIIRNIIISEYSLSDAGLWDGISRISKTIFGLAVSTLSLYYIPLISKNQSGEELNRKINDTLKIAMPIIILGVSIVYVFRRMIVSILFTSEFEEMHNLFLYQNLGDIIRLFNWFYAVTFIIKEKIKIYIISELVMAVFYALLIYYLIPLLGIENCTLPYLINTLMYLIVTQYIYRKYIK